MRARKCRFFVLLGLIATGCSILACGGDVDTHMAEVRALQDVGQYAASIPELRKILAVSAERPEAHYRLGVALAQTGNPSRAVWALQKASESEDFQISATLLLASIQLNLGNYEESIRAADRVLEIEADHRVALQIRSQANLGSYNLQQALADTDRLLELHPDDYPILAVRATVLAEMGHLEEAEEAQFLVKQMAEKSGDVQIASRGCLAPALFAKIDLKDIERAEELYDDCASKYPSNAFVIGHIMGFLDSIAKPERATELIRTAVEKEPENLSLRATLANRLVEQGETDQAEALLREAVESFASAAAWNLLVAHHRRLGESEKALSAIEKVEELTGGGGDPMRFTHADLLLDIGDLEGAEAIAKTLEEPSYASMIRGRIMLAEGDAQSALQAFEEGIRNWPDNAGARYLAGIAALQLGDFERAIVELRESVRADNRATDASRALARLYFDRGDYPAAINFSRLSARGKSREQRAEDLKVGARSFAALGNFKRARAAAQALHDIPGHEAEAAVEFATIERLAAGPVAAVEAIHDLGLDLSEPANEKVLRALTENLILANQIDEALTAIDSVLERDAERASVHALRGVVLVNAGRSGDAQVALQRAIDIDNKQSEAIGGLGTLAEQSGDRELAIELFDQAARLNPNSEAFPYWAAQLTLAVGNHEEAEARMLKIVKMFPGHAGARNDLAWILAEKEADLNLALTLAEEASRLSSAPDILDTLGFVHLKRGEAFSAVDVLERALAGAPHSASVRYRLGVALSESGDTERARKMLTEALASGPFLEEAAARRALAQLATP